MTTTHLYGAGLLAQDNGTNEQFLLSDALGSTRLVVNAAGSVVGAANYDAYGTQTTSGAGSVFGFTGQQADAESGLLYLRARMYDPATGVFLQRDPFPFDTTDPATIDRYSYVGNNPVNLTDPSGRFTVGLCISGSAGFWAGGNVTDCIVTANFLSLGFTSSAGGGFQTPTLGIGGQVQFSNEDSIAALNGWSGYAGASAGEGISLGGDVSLGTSGDSCQPTINGFDVGLGLGIGSPVDIHGGASYTRAWTLADLVPPVY